MTCGNSGRVSGGLAVCASAFRSNPSPSLPRGGGDLCARQTKRFNDQIINRRLRIEQASGIVIVTSKRSRNTLHSKLLGSSLARAHGSTAFSYLPECCKSVSAYRHSPPPAFAARGGCGSRTHTSDSFRLLISPTQITSIFPEASFLRPDENDSGKGC